VFSQEVKWFFSASRFIMLTDILPLVDYAVDFHAGGASRFNAPQIRLAPNNQINNIG
jgi:hypothetical protein